MREVIMAGKSYPIYTKAEASKAGISYREDWQNAETGDYVLTGDGFVVPVVHAAPLSTGGRRVRIPTGTFSSKMSKEITTEDRENRYSFGGKDLDRKNPDRPLSRQEKLFCKAYNTCRNAALAYKEASGRMEIDKGVAKRMGTILMGRANVQVQVFQDLRERLEEHGVTENRVIRDYIAIVDHEECPFSVRKSVNDTFAKMLGMLDNRKTGGTIPFDGEISEGDLGNIEALTGGRPAQIGSGEDADGSGDETES